MPSENVVRIILVTLYYRIGLYRRCMNNSTEAHPFVLGCKNRAVFFIFFKLNLEKPEYM